MNAETKPLLWLADHWKKGTGVLDFWEWLGPALPKLETNYFDFKPVKEFKFGPHDMVEHPTLTVPKHLEWHIKNYAIKHDVFISQSEIDKLDEEISKAKHKSWATWHSGYVNQFLTGNDAWFIGKHKSINEDFYAYMYGAAKQLQPKRHKLGSGKVRWELYDDGCGGYRLITNASPILACVSGRRGSTPSWDFFFHSALFLVRITEPLTTYSPCPTFETFPELPRLSKSAPCFLACPTTKSSGD